jgi:effector-binding domain-containing protein
MRLFLFSILLLSVLPLMATEQAFPPTAPGVAEFKTLPAGVLLKSTGRGNYFEESNRLFRPLFNYISSQKIAMTTPVEAQIDQAAMYFWVAPSEVAKVAGDRAGVEVIRLPARQVASLGARGGYGRENFEQTRDKLRAWLETQPDVEATGEAYAVYWHGPFTPWFAKRSEVHIPVRAKGI